MKGIGLGAGAAVVASTALLAVTPAGLAASGPELREARSAARAVVREHPSYRVIRSSHPLRVRRCWRASRRVARCSLYRIAPTPCALDGGDGICAQVLARRVWLVDVRLRGGRVVARIVRITDTA